MTCLCGVHSSVPAGPVSNPSCTRPRVVWYWTSPSGSPPVLSTTSSSLTSSLTSCHLQFLRPLNPLSAVKTCTCPCHLHPRSAPSARLPISLHLFLQTSRTVSCVFMSPSCFFLRSFLLGFCPPFPETPLSGPQRPHGARRSLPGQAASSLGSLFKLCSFWLRWVSSAA